MRSIVALLALIFAAAAAANCTPEENEECYEITVQIVDKARLPKERLAEAIAAKAILVDSKKFLLEAAGMMPEDPLYPFLLAQRKVSYREGDGEPVLPRPPPALSGPPSWVRDYSHARPFLEHCLQLDSSYLPAQYAYAMRKPTYELRMKALERVARLDPDNARPYYLMAYETWTKVSEGRRILEESGNNAFDVTQAEWKTVSELIAMGNERRALDWQHERIPSAYPLADGSGRRRPWNPTWSGVPAGAGIWAERTMIPPAVFCPGGYLDRWQGRRFGLQR